MNNPKGSFELFKLFQDGMILQRNTLVKIWGFADSGLKVGLNFLGKEYRAVTGDDGEFVFDIQTGDAGGPYSMIIFSESETYELKDILLGDVYFLNGQSNMELPVGRILDHVGKEPEETDYPQIREFRVPIRPAFRKEERQFEEGRWFKAQKKDIYEMSSIGVYFAKYLYESRKIPIGLVNCSVGGTPIEAHLPEEELRKYKIYDAEIEKNKDINYVKQTEAEDLHRMENWYKKLDSTDEGYEIKNPPYAAEEMSDEDWSVMQIPRHFRNTELDSFIGSVWFRYEFYIPQEYNLSGAMLRLGALIDADMTYINGILVGQTEYMYPPRRYEIADNVLKHGKNLLALRLIINRNMGGFVCNKKYSLSWEDGREIDLIGEWKYRKAVAMEELPLQTFFQYKPSVIYKGMIYPILKYKFKGSLWYQGESNESNASVYAKLMRHLIRCYREWFGEDFPFFYVQLPQFDDPAGFVGKNAWAQIREQQRQVLDMDNTAMVVTIDIGESNDLHPQLKPEVAYRLYLCAEALIYNNDNVVYSGPVLQSAFYNKTDNNVVIKFLYCNGGLILKNNMNFEICTDIENDVWEKAENVRKISEDALCILNPSKERTVQAVRYCYTNCPEDPSIYNKAGLPASPFVCIL